ncbi:MAG: hypothetical protein A3G25_01180 [Betaproteobacteria bacterium RIFCSPLOWO2_12_FULL_63_13]|nr:MAG: hypothetical protein A3G25_01180 [Betaproteobacteria bacterium RIFCSPLOWO2_12_FULL_63_13]
MTTDIDEQWERLCQEHDAARDAFFNAFLPVRASFGAAAASGEPLPNPLFTQLQEWEAAEAAWNDVIQRMKHFVETHVPLRK